MIIETSDNRFYAVVEPTSADLAHCWWGTEMKKVKQGWIPKKNARSLLIRKAATRVVEA